MPICVILVIGLVALIMLACTLAAVFAVMLSSQISRELEEKGIDDFRRETMGAVSRMGRPGGR